jgi:hypothetical protein
MKDFSQHGSEKRKKNFWNRMGGKDSSKATDPFSPLYWHKRFGTWAEGGEPNNAGFQALPDYVKAKILSNMAYGGMTYPFMQDGGPALTEEQKAAAEAAAAKKKKRNETVATVGAALGTVGFIVGNEIRNKQKQGGYDIYVNSNDPRVNSGTSDQPSNKELRQLYRNSRKMYGGDTDMYGGEMDMDAMYQMMKGGQPCYECGGKVYQQGGQEQDQVMQAIQMYAQMTQMDPEQLMAQLQAMSPEEQQQAIQQIMQAIQQAQQGQSPQMAYGGININPANKGKFTASANRAGMSVQDFASKVLANKEDYSSTQVKRANFAKNAAGWKKQMGGMTEGQMLELHDDEIQNLIDQGYGIEYLD